MVHPNKKSISNKAGEKFATVSPVVIESKSMVLQNAFSPFFQFNHGSSPRTSKNIRLSDPLILFLLLMNFRLRILLYITFGSSELNRKPRLYTSQEFLETPILMQQDAWRELIFNPKPSFFGEWCVALIKRNYLLYFSTIILNSFHYSRID